jgi:hypothetical protein
MGVGADQVEAVAGLAEVAGAGELVVGQAQRLEARDLGRVGAGGEEGEAAAESLAQPAVAERQVGGRGAGAERGGSARSSGASSA